MRMTIQYGTSRETIYFLKSPDRIKQDDGNDNDETGNDDSDLDGHMVMINPFHQVVKEEVVESCIIDDPDMEIQVFIAISKILEKILHDLFHCR